MNNSPKYLLSGLALAATGLSLNVFANEELPKPEVTEQWTPKVEVVTPGPVPSDATVLFDGSDFSQWLHGDGREVEWLLADNAMTVKPGSKGIKSKQNFCDMQMHIEWRTPAVLANKNGQGSGNSGIFIQGRYEIQVLNSFQNETYANGQAGSIYKQSAPLVNASLPPMQWQSYDIIYRAPRFDEDGNVREKARITALHNGVVIQNHFEIQGPTVYRGYPSYGKAHGCGPIYLQDHGDEVSYRNIWVREL